MTKQLCRHGNESDNHFSSNKEDTSEWSFVHYDLKENRMIMSHSPIRSAKRAEGGSHLKI
jgi:hypothetical protein